MVRIRGQQLFNAPEPGSPAQPAIQPPGGASSSSSRGGRHYSIGGWLAGFKALAASAGMVKALQHNRLTGLVAAPAPAAALRKQCRDVHSGGFV
jgi:hypothetical protein